jgi:hypothetical protein
MADQPLSSEELRDNTIDLKNRLQTIWDSL